VGKRAQKNPLKKASTGGVGFARPNPPREVKRTEAARCTLNRDSSQIKGGQVSAESAGNLWALTITRPQVNKGATSKMV